MQILVIGLGQFGYALLKEITGKKGCEVIVMEENQERAQQVRDMVNKVIVGDATHKDVLEQFAKDVDCAVVCLGEKTDRSLLITYLLKEVGVKKIIAKASSEEHGAMLRVIGAHEVIFPEGDSAKRLAANLISPDILEFIKLSTDFDIMEIAAPEQFLKKSMGDLKLRNNYGIDVLAVKNPLTGAVTILPSVDYVIQPDDVFVVLGAVDSLRKMLA